MFTVVYRNNWQFTNHVKPVRLGLIIIRSLISARIDECNDCEKYS